MACATDHLCLIREIPRKHIHQTETHYFTEFHESVVCHITRHSPHIPHSISKPSILSCKIYKILTTVI